MATPTFLRYLPSRLKPLGIPAVWISLGLFGLISVLIWEYHKNPQWFEREPISNVVNPDSGLTPEEEARLAEVDTLDVLLQGSKVPEGSPQVTSTINPNAPDATAANGDGNDKLSGQANPFKVYADEYRFPGTSETTLTTGNPSGGSLGSSPGGVPYAPSALSNSSFNGSSQSAPSGPAATSQPAAGSALSQALDRQQAAEAANANSGGSGSAASGINSPSYPGGSGNNRNASGAQSAPSPAAPIPAPYIRTTPEMSPPAGTTGYQVPASSSLPVFNLAPPQPTRNAAPSTTGVPSNPDSPSGTLYTAPTSVQPTQTPPARQRF